MTKPTHYTAYPAETFGDEAPGVTIRWVISGQQSAANFAMRVIEVAPGGHTPYHAHPFEHQNFVLEGEGTVTIGEEVYPIEPGHVIYVPPDVMHQYTNTGGTPLRFICGIPVTPESAQ